MELIYLYIEDDEKNIKDCEFNFSPEYRFSYDREKKFIDVQKNDNYIPNFWGTDNISNITAVVGKNGVGKSNLIQIIANPKVSSEIITIYKENDEIVLYSNIQKVIDEMTTQCKSVKLDDKAHVLLPIVYFCPNIYQSISLDLFQHKKSINISTQSLLNIDLQSHSINGTDSGGALISMGKMLAMGGRLHYHGYGNFLRQIDFLNQYPSFDINGIILPNNCIIQTYSLSFNTKINASTKWKKITENCRKIFVDSCNTEKHRSDNLKAFWYLSVFMELLSFCLDMNIEHEIDAFLDQNKSLHYRTITILFFNTLTKSGLKNGNEINELFLSLDKTFQSIEVKPKSNALNSTISLLDAKSIMVVYSKLLDIYNVALLEKYSRKEVVRRDLFFEQCIKINWNYPLSSGEEAYLNLFASLHYAKSQIHDQEQQYLLILDEPELSLHPSLQRKFVDILVNSVPQIFKGIEIQIIIASHSPILISDFPKDNIIFLNKNPDGTCKVIDSISRDNTFGANIHTLYRNSFFIDGLPIGEFAKKKINKLFDELEDVTTTRPSILKEIQLIGEPILREQLMKRYKQREGLSDEVNSRIYQLKKEIDYLKRRLDDKN